MGNSKSIELSGEAKAAASRFSENELHILLMTFEDLARRSADGKGIDKDTFLKYFPLAGILGDRLFAAFDTKHMGVIDLEEFLIALSDFSKGTLDDKINFLFKMYDIRGDGHVTKSEMQALVNHMPRWALHVRKMNFPANKSTETDEINDSIDEFTNVDIVEKAFEECDVSHEGKLTKEEFKLWVERTPEVLKYLENILPFANSSEAVHATSQKELLPEGTKLLKIRRGNIDSTDMLSEELLNNRRSISVPHSQMNSPAKRMSVSLHNVNVASRTTSGKDLLPPLHPLATTQSTSQQSLDTDGIQVRTASEAEVIEIPTDDDGLSQNEVQIKQLLIQAMDLAETDALRESIAQIITKELAGNKVAVKRLNTLEFYQRVVKKESYLWKIGETFHLWSKRWYILSGSCMYYYANEKDLKPKGVVFLAGCLIEKYVDEASEQKHFYGFQIIQQDFAYGGSKENEEKENRVLYAKSAEERDAWISQLRRAAEVVPIEDDYVIGKELGRGRYSHVCECLKKATSERFAVKIIEKASMDVDEKIQLRTEIAILKLVDHPNIIHLEGLYETRTHIYIVMEKLVGGELFERIVNHPRFTEEAAAALIKPILESVAYLHDLGIVHRDLKPENILCGERIEDIKIADFGLSKIVLPEEKMDMACGTLSYVAPEVLTMKGYGSEADIWSCGVILYLVLCGRLPFDGATQDEIVKNTIQADLKLNQGVVAKLSDDAKSFLQALLHKNPKSRITARDALHHPFILKNCPLTKKWEDNSSSPSNTSTTGTPTNRRIYE